MGCYIIVLNFRLFKLFIFNCYFNLGCIFFCGRQVEVNFIICLDVLCWFYQFLDILEVYGFGFSIEFLQEYVDLVYFGVVIFGGQFFWICLLKKVFNDYMFYVIKRQ